MAALRANCFFFQVLNVQLLTHNKSDLGFSAVCCPAVHTVNERGWSQVAATLLSRAPSGFPASSVEWQRRAELHLHAAGWQVHQDQEAASAVAQHDEGGFHL